MKKVIFLDHDGVICLSTEWGGRLKKRSRYCSKHGSTEFQDLPVDCRFDNFNQKAVRILNQLLDETGAEIVVSSDWRYHATLEEMGEYYLSQGISKVPLDFTPKTKDIDPEFWSKFSVAKNDLESERSFEILYWLSKHPEVTHWVAVDDLDMSKTLNNFVLTPRCSEGMKQSGIKEKILNFLQ